MNINIITYLIYIPIVIIITFFVGWILYKNGETFLIKIMPFKYVKPINKSLLTGYYLINIGYTINLLSNTQKLINSLEATDFIISSLSKLILTLAIMHYINIFTLTKFSKTF